MPHKKGRNKRREKRQTEMNKHDRQGLQVSGRNLNTNIAMRPEYTRGEKTSLSNGFKARARESQRTPRGNEVTQLSGIPRNICDHQSSPPTLPSWEHKHSTGGWGMAHAEIQVGTTPSLLCTCKDSKLCSGSFIGHSWSHRTLNWTRTGVRGVERCTSHALLRNPYLKVLERP